MTTLVDIKKRDCFVSTHGLCVTFLNEMNKFPGFRLEIQNCSQRRDISNFRKLVPQICTEVTLFSSETQMIRFTFQNDTREEREEGDVIV